MSQPIKKSRRPDTSLIVMFVLVIGASVWAFAQEGTGGLQSGLEITLGTILNVGPEVLLGIGLAGMLQVAVPPGLVSRWMGEGSGLKGVAVGVAAGLVAPGGPYILFPIAASLMGTGAGIAPLSAFVAARNSANLNRLVVWDVPFLGIPFSLARIVCCIPMVAAQVIFTPVLFRMMGKGSREEAMRQRTAKAPASGGPGGT